MADDQQGDPDYVTPTGHHGSRDAGESNAGLQQGDTGGEALKRPRDKQLSPTLPLSALAMVVGVSILAASHLEVTEGKVRLKPPTA